MNIIYVHTQLILRPYLPLYVNRINDTSPAVSEIDIAVWTVIVNRAQWSFHAGWRQWSWREDYCIGCRRQLVVSGPGPQIGAQEHRGYAAFSFLVFREQRYHFSAQCWKILGACTKQVIIHFCRAYIGARYHAHQNFLALCDRFTLPRSLFSPAITRSERNWNHWCRLSGSASKQYWSYLRCLEASYPAGGVVINSIFSILSALIPFNSATTCSNGHPHYSCRWSLLPRLFYRSGNAIVAVIDGNARRAFQHLQGRAAFL